MSLPTNEPRPSSFTDLSGREWSIELNYVMLRAIKKIGADLGTLEQLGPVWAKILHDDEHALDVIWIAIRDSDSDDGKDDWLSKMDGSRLDEARNALLGALVNFTPAKREMIAASAAKIDEQYRKAITEQAEKIGQLTDETIQRAMKKLREHPPGSKPSRSQVSSGTSTIGGRSGKRSRR